MDQIENSILNEDLNSKGCLWCPVSMCGEIFDLEWLSLFPKKILFDNILKKHRNNFIATCIGLSECPTKNCGLFLHIKYDSAVSTSNGIPFSVLCRNSHKSCLNCKADAHSPLRCSDLKIWNGLVSDFCSKNQFNSSNHVKNCPKCNLEISKDIGCNKIRYKFLTFSFILLYVIIRCVKCRTIFCWVCLQDWSYHTNKSNINYKCNRSITKISNPNEPICEEKVENYENSSKPDTFLENFKQNLVK
jgi:hypothetical protein